MPYRLALAHALPLVLHSHKELSGGQSSPVCCYYAPDLAYLPRLLGVVLCLILPPTQVGDARTKGKVGCGVVREVDYQGNRTGIGYKRPIYVCDRDGWQDRAVRCWHG